MKKEEYLNVLVTNINNLCCLKGISVNELGKISGVGKDIIANMNKGSLPSCDKIAKVADALDCSIDCLLGRTNSPNSITNGDISNSSVAQANGNNNQISIQSNNENPYAEIIEHLGGLSEGERRHAIADLMDVLENQYPVKKK